MDFSVVVSEQLNQQIRPVLAQNQHHRTWSFEDEHSDDYEDGDCEDDEDEDCEDNDDDGDDEDDDDDDDYDHDHYIIIVITVKCSVRIGDPYFNT